MQNSVKALIFAKKMLALGSPAKVKAASKTGGSSRVQNKACESLKEREHAHATKDGTTRDARRGQ